MPASAATSSGPRAAAGVVGGHEAEQAAVLGDGAYLAHRLTGELDSPGDQAGGGSFSPPSLLTYSGEKPRKPRASSSSAISRSERPFLRSGSMKRVSGRIGQDN